MKLTGAEIFCESLRREGVKTIFGLPGGVVLKIFDVLDFDACLMATLQAYKDAGLSGLCHEGRWECAVDAIRTLDLQALMQTLTSPATGVS